MRDRTAQSPPSALFFPLTLLFDSRRSSTRDSPFRLPVPQSHPSDAMPPWCLVHRPPAGDARASVPCGLCFPFPTKTSSAHFIFRIHSALSIGHGFGGIPAPCSFVSSAFPFPPKNSSQTTAKTFCAPPEMQTLALGADPSRFQVPQLQGQKMELEKNVRKSRRTNRVFR
jgi:hypothetical protein